MRFPGALGMVLLLYLLLLLLPWASWRSARHLRAARSGTAPPGLAHLIQEWKSVGIIFLMALLMHTLMWFTGTLVVAMVVHAVYDIVAGIVGSRDAVRFEREAAAGPEPRARRWPTLYYRPSPAGALARPTAPASASSARA